MPLLQANQVIGAGVLGKVSIPSAEVWVPLQLGADVWRITVWFTATSGPHTSIDGWVSFVTLENAALGTTDNCKPIPDGAEFVHECSGVEKRIMLATQGSAGAAWVQTEGFPAARPAARKCP